MSKNIKKNLMFPNNFGCVIYNSSYDIFYDLCNVTDLNQCNEHSQVGYLRYDPNQTWSLFLCFLSFNVSHYYITFLHKSWHGSSTSDTGNIPVHIGHWLQVPTH